MKKSKKLQREWAKKVNVSAANQSVNASRHTLTKHVPKVGLPDVTFECEPSLGLWENLPNRQSYSYI